MTTRTLIAGVLLICVLLGAVGYASLKATEQAAVAELLPD